MISIVIPVYHMAGHGEAMLNDLLESLQKQTYNNYEVIVSDDSGNPSLHELCGDYDNVKYYINPGTKGACSNLNNAILHAKGSIIKPMFQDDQFLDPECLEKIWVLFANPMAHWCICTSAHTSDRGDHVPYINTNIYELARGCNTFGSPSAVAWKRNDLTFDENLKWLFDCDFYARMVNEYGQPDILDTKVLIREWDGMATRTIADGGVRVQELGYIESKFINLKP
jgi:glycosyltransferase involved in cell wall biosynthesis